MIPEHHASLDTISLPVAEVLASLSYALDLTSGQPMGHAPRTADEGRRLHRRAAGETRLISALRRLHFPSLGL